MEAVNIQQIRLGRQFVRVDVVKFVIVIPIALRFCDVWRRIYEFRKRGVSAKITMLCCTNIPDESEHKFM